MQMIVKTDKVNVNGLDELTIGKIQIVWPTYEYEYEYGIYM